MHHTQRIFSNTLYQFVGKAVTSGLGVVITIFLTRYLGPAGFGKYTFALVFVTLFGVIGDWGMTLIGVREASRKIESAGEIVGNILVVRFLLAFVAIILSNIAVFVLPYSTEIRTLVGISSLSLLALSIKTSFQIVFNARLRMEFFALSELAANALVIFLVAFLIAIKAGLPMIMVAFLSGQIFAAGVAWLLGVRLSPIKLSLFRKETAYILAESLPMGAILVLFTVYNRIDTVLLSYFKGEEAVGLYGAAYRIFEVLVLGAAYFANSILPLISNLAMNNRSALKVVYEKAMIILLLMGIAAAVVNFLLAPIGIAIVAGSKFSGAILALQILSLALVVSYLNHLNGYTLIALGKQWYSFAIAIVALVINLGLNVIFIPRFSLYAAAAITFVTEGIIATLSFLVIRHIIGVRMSPEFVLETIKEWWKHKGKLVFLSRNFE
jgi:O-antigen/teichoic acid export membrane protein